MPTDPNDIVDRMMQGFAGLQKLGKPNKAAQLRAAYGGLIKPMPKHIQRVCGMLEALSRRAHAAETFKTWGTPEEIAANIGKIKPVKLERPKFPVKLSTLFPSPPVDRNQSFSDVLE